MQVNKWFCDRCGEEIDYHKINIFPGVRRYESKISLRTDHGDGPEEEDLCPKCAAALQMWFEVYKPNEDLLPIDDGMDDYTRQEYIKYYLQLDPVSMTSALRAYANIMATFQYKTQHRFDAVEAAWEGATEAEKAFIHQFAVENLMLKDTKPGS